MKIIIPVLFALIILAAGCVSQGGQAANQTNQPTAVLPNNSGNGGNSVSGLNIIEISGFAFSPSTISVSRGAQVTWINKDSVPHTVTGPDFDSNTLENGQNYSHSFSQAGSIEYHCSIHPSMKGTIIVK